MKKTLKTIGIAVGILFLLFYVAGNLHVFGLENTKSDTECTGLETAGRCQDKCPNETDTLQGYDKETRAAVCRSAPTGCPYGDSIPLGADCDKHAPLVQSTTIEEPVTSPVDYPSEEFTGK